MSRVSSWFHRIFGGWQPIADDIVNAVFGPFVQECATHPEYTAQDRRDLAVKLVTGYISSKFPEYGWVAKYAIEFILNAYEARTSRH